MAVVAMPHKNSRPAGNRATRTSTTLYDQHTAPESDFDFDRHIVDRVDESIWRALFDGHFRLAVRCDVCGRWLTAGASKRAHRGPRCRAKAAAS
jgi:hypothetical protein